MILISSRSTSQFLPVNLISSSLYFKFIPLRHCACVYTLAAHAEIINFLAPSRALAHGAFFFFSVSFTSTPLSLLISPSYNLLSSAPLCLPPHSLTSLIWWSIVGGQWVYGGGGQSETQAGAGVAAAERDGYNNPRSRSTHVLNYCHKCSSVRSRSRTFIRNVSLSHFTTRTLTEGNY